MDFAGESGSPSVKLRCNPVGSFLCFALRAAESLSLPFTTNVALVTAPCSNAWKMPCERGGFIPRSSALMMSRRSTDEVYRRKPAGRRAVFPGDQSNVLQARKRGCS